MGLRASVAMSCGVGHRCGSDSELLWLWYRPAAVAPIRPLAWELLYAKDAALKGGGGGAKKSSFAFISEFCPHYNVPCFSSKFL